MTPNQRERIRSHGENLLRIFPFAVDRDPVRLCKKLRRLEILGESFALQCCNGPSWSSEFEADEIARRLLTAVNKLLGNASVPIFVNRDARGYALKIDDSYMTPDIVLHRDWGNYGILAPKILP